MRDLPMTNAGLVQGANCPRETDANSRCRRGAGEERRGRGEAEGDRGLPSADEALPSSPHG